MGRREQQALLEGVTLPWGPDDTQRYLTDYPLPNTFTWRGKEVVPRYRIKKGYGFWLRTTPYHPGLFEALNRFCAMCDHYPTPEEMAAAMTRIEEAARATQTQLPLGGSKETP